MQQFVSSETAPAPAPGAADKRQAKRIPHHGHAQLLTWPAGRRTTPIDVEVVDYSRTGIGIIHNEVVLVGQKFVVREPEVTQGSNTCIYTVARCDRRPDGRFSIGLHRCESETTTEPMEDPHIEPAKWLQWAYFLFAAIGAAVVLVMAWKRHFH